MQETRKKGGILPVLYICLILWLCGLALIGGAYKSKKESEAIKSQDNRATAYITGVSEYEVYDEDGDLRDVRDIYIAYELHGEAYKYVIKDAYMCASENDIGEPVEIYYDGENPAVITGKCGKQGFDQAVPRHRDLLHPHRADPLFRYPV